jgi:beta-glucosidase
MPLAARAFALLYLAAAAAAACIGEFSTCPNGACALLASACGQCGAGLYACPLSSSCFAPGPAGAGYATCPGLAGTHFDATLPLAARLDAMFATPWTVAEYISQMTENATAIARLSLPAYSWLNDDQHGVKQADATAFPNGNSLGASWNAPLLTRVGLAIGVEARGTHNSLSDKSAETGGHQWPGTINNGAGLTLYAPNVNLVHDPRWGRAQEVMSECPKLTGDLVTAYVRGLQNNSAPKIADAGTLLTIACCKHYAVYNTETIPTDRHHFNAVVGARALWETYLPVFEQCLGKAASQSIMCSCGRARRAAPRPPAQQRPSRP